MKQYFIHIFTLPDPLMTSSPEFPSQSCGSHHISLCAYPLLALFGSLLHILESLNKNTVLFLQCQHSQVWQRCMQRMSSAWGPNPEHRIALCAHREYHPARKQRWLFLGFLTLNFPKGKRLYEIIFGWFHNPWHLANEHCLPPPFQWKLHLDRVKARLLGSVGWNHRFPPKECFQIFLIRWFYLHQIIWHALYIVWLC